MDKIITAISQYVSKNELSQGVLPMNIGPEAILIGAAVDVIKETERCLTDYLKCREHEETERARIRAQLSAFTQLLDAQKEIYLKQLEKDYETRQKIYNSANQALQLAMEKWDTQFIKEVLNLMAKFYIDTQNKEIHFNIPLLE